MGTPSGSTKDRVKCQDAGWLAGVLELRGGLTWTQSVPSGDFSALSVNLVSLSEFVRLCVHPIERRVKVGL